MAITISGVGCAENFNKVAIYGATYEDPILEGIGCIPQSRMDASNALAVNIFYLPPETAVDPGATPLPYAQSASAVSGAIKEMSNTVKTVALRNFFNDAISLPYPLLDSVPYEAAGDAINGLANKASRENLNMEVACLVNEGTASTYTATGSETADQLLALKYGQVKKAISDMKKTNFKPRFALVSQDIYDKVVEVAGAAFTGDIRNEIAFTGDIGRYNGIVWAATPVLGQASGSVKYYDYAGTLHTVDISGVEAILIDGDYFAAISKLNNLSLKDGGAYAGSVIATQDRQFGATLLNASAAFFVRPNA